MGVIEISQPDIANPDATEVRHVLPFASPAPSRKRFDMLVRIDGSRPFDVHVLFEDHLRTVRDRVDLSATRMPIVLCIGVPLEYRTGTSNEQYRFVSLPVATVPDDPLALDGVFAVFVSGSDLAKLSQSQRDALRRWGITGGKLAFCEMSADPVMTALLEELLGDTPFDAYRPGTVARWGAGTVANIGRAANGPARTAVFPWRDTEQHFSPFASRGGIFTSLWRSRRSYGIGAFLWVLFIVGAYIGVIGPLDWLVIRKLKRPYLTWAFFGGAIVWFSILAHAYSGIVNIGAMRTVCTDVLDTGLDAGTVRGNSQFWVYSARNATYNITSEREHVCFSARQGMRGVGSVAGVQVINGRHSSMRARIPIYSSKLFDATWYADWPFEIELAREKDAVVLQVPDALAVRKAYLATRTGLTRLVLQGRAGNVQSFRSSTVGEREWDNIMTEFKDLKWTPEPFRWFTDRTKDLLPGRETLDQYMLAMSCPWTPDKESGFPGMPDSLAYRRDARERSFDTRARLLQGDLLLLFVADSEALFPLEIHKHRPDTARATLVRIQVPANS